MTQIYLLPHFHHSLLALFLTFLDDLSLLLLPFLFLLLDDLFFVLLLQSALRLLIFLFFPLLLALLPSLYSASSLFSCMPLAFDLSDLRIPLYSSPSSYELYRIPAFLHLFFFHSTYSTFLLLPFCFHIAYIDLGLNVRLHSILYHIHYCMAVDIYFFLFFLSYYLLLYLFLLFLVLLFSDELVLLLRQNHILCYILLSLFSSHLGLLSLACLLVCLESLVTFFIIFYFHYLLSLFTFSIYFFYYITLPPTFFILSFSFFFFYLLFTFY